MLIPIKMMCVYCMSHKTPYSFNFQFSQANEQLFKTYNDITCF